MTLINWKWANAKERYKGFYTATTGLPPDVLMDGVLAQKTRQAFLGGRCELYRPLRSYQPRTWQILTEQCAEPMVVQKTRYPDDCGIVTYNNDLVIFVEPFEFVDDHINWIEIYAALPAFLHPYYSNFNGMHASFSILSPASLNLPAPVTKWRRLSDFQKERSIPRRDMTKIIKTLGDMDNVYIFVETEWKDLLLLSKNSSDKKIYGVPSGMMQDFFEIASPAESLDALFSHVLSGSVDPFPIKRDFT